MSHGRHLESMMSHKNPTHSVSAYLFEEQSCRISSRYDLITTEPWAFFAGGWFVFRFTVFGVGLSSWLKWLACSTARSWVRVPLAAGRRLATVGQLLFAPCAWAYLTLYPLGIGNWVWATAGKV